MEDLRKLAKVDTHENIAIEYETANAGSRFIAFVIDTLISGVIVVAAIIVLIVVMAIVGVSSQTPEDAFLYVALIIILVFLVRNGYFLLFEIIWKGVTPGKKAQKIRVVSTTGAPITFGMALIRNLMRLVDSLPTSYLVGFLFLVFTGKSQRLGDLLANTMVVKVREDRTFSRRLESLLQEEASESPDVDLFAKYHLTPSVAPMPASPVDSESELSLSPSIQTAFVPVEEAPTYPNLSQDQYEILRAYLQQRRDIPEAAQYDIQLYHYFHRVTKTEEPERPKITQVIRFLKSVEEANRPFYQVETETKQ